MRLIVAILAVCAFAVSLFAVACSLDRAGSSTGGAQSSGPRLTWPPPSLNAPVSEISVRTSGGLYRGGGRDCRVRFPGAAVTRRTDIVGCHDVVIVGGDLNIGGSVVVGSTAGVGLWVKDFTGLAHIEGLRIRGSGLSDALWISSGADNATAQVENVRVDAVRAARPVTDCKPCRTRTRT